jgi:16S rRNA (guanine527-N7)-methyltransferase
VFHVKSTPPAAEAIQAVESLCRRYALSQSENERLSAFLDILVEDPEAPTAIRDSAVAVDQHLADSLVGLEVQNIADATSIVDLGSGAGVPGLPIAIAQPGSRVSLLESKSRKCEFLARAISVTKTHNALVVNERAEQWVLGLESQDAALARAIAPASVVAEYAAPLLRVGGALVDWRGRLDHREGREATAAAKQLGLELCEIRRVEPFVGARDRHLLVYIKILPTPPRFPRRAGIARKRPLGAADIPFAQSGAPADRDRR